MFYKNSIDTSPIIFIPGIMGSELYLKNNTYTDKYRIWPPSISNVVSISKKLDIKNPLYTAPVDDLNLPGSKKQYGAFSSYKKTIEFLCEKFPLRAVYFFSYDFRKSNAKVAEELNTFLSGLSSRVCLICHSMGGLVASNYISLYGDKKIKQIIFCGVPFEGSTTALNTALTDDLLATRFDKDFKGKMFQVFDFMIENFLGIDQKLKTDFFSLAELLPYEQLYARHHLYYSKNNSKYYTLSKNKTRELFLFLFPNTYSTAYRIQKDLQSSIYKKLFSMANAYFIIGRGEPTIHSLKLKEYENKIQVDDINFEFSGDGTVEYASATALNKILKLNPENVLIKNTDHHGTCSNDGALNYIYDILAFGTSNEKNDEKAVEEYEVIKLDSLQPHSVYLKEKEVISNKNGCCHKCGVTCITTQNKTYFCLPSNPNYILKPCDSDKLQCSVNIKYYKST